jgi:hypothetical protein
MSVASINAMVWLQGLALMLNMLRWQQFLTKLKDFKAGNLTG